MKEVFIGGVSVPEKNDAKEAKTRDRIKHIELELLMEAICQRYGFHFRDCGQGFVRRKVHEHMKTEGLSTISTLQSRVLHDSKAMERLLVDLVVPDIRLTA